MSTHWPEAERHLFVSRETYDKLAIYVGLLEKWNKTINLVSPSSLSDVWKRHVSDSAQLLKLASPRVTRWADLGSGGGLPGLVISILAQEDLPNLTVTLVESDQRKCAFLRAVKHALSLDATILADRIEACPPLGCDVVSARAVAPLSRLLPYALLHLKPEGKALFLKGKSYKDEITQARRDWFFTVETHSSVTDPSSVILEVEKISDGR